MNGVNQLPGCLLRCSRCRSDVASLRRTKDGYILVYRPRADGSEHVTTLTEPVTGDLDVWCPGCGKEGTLDGARVARQSHGNRSSMPVKIRFIIVEPQGGWA